MSSALDSRATTVAGTGGFESADGASLAETESSASITATPRRTVAGRVFIS
jgi:hypothetical protein